MSTATYDANDPNDVAERQQQADRAEFETRSLIKDVLGQAAGRAWLFSLIHDTGYFGRSFTGDALTSAFNEGSRSVGQAIFNLCMRADPNVVPAMLRENAHKVFHV